MTQRWLSLIGIGEDGALTPAARALIDDAALIVGGSRHLALIGATSAARMQWPSPFTIDAVLARRGEKVVVLASGDPFFYGVGELISRHVAPDEMFCMPSPSAFAFAASRLCWSQQDCALLSLHGRAFERITPHFQPGRRLLVLSWDGTTPALLAEHLTSRGFGEFGSACAGKSRRPARAGAQRARRKLCAHGYRVAEYGCAWSSSRSPARASFRCTPGLPDEWFEHDGQITKRDIRAVTLSALAPRKRRAVVGHWRGLRLDRHRMDAGRSRQSRNRNRGRIRRGRRASHAMRPALGRSGSRHRARRARLKVLRALPLPDAIFVGGGADARRARCGMRGASRRRPARGQRRDAGNAEPACPGLQCAWAAILRMSRSRRARAVGRFHALASPRCPCVQWRAVKR